MGTGTASGSERALKAAKQAISSPLLEDVSIDGATGIIINITGNSSLTTFETNQAVTLIMEAADEDAEIIFGTVIDDNMGEEIKVTVIATGLRTAKKETSNFLSRPVMATPAQEYIAPIRSEAPKMEATYSQAPVENKNTDYAVKSEISFDLDDQVAPHTESKPKINWAEKLQNAASKYESQKNFDAPEARPAASSSSSEARTEYTHYDNSAPLEAVKNENNGQVTQNRENRIKSIAEKLGFFNFDEDEFDTPSFMKKNERNHDSQI